MDTFVASIIGALITLFFLRRYLKQLTASHGSAASRAPAAQSASAEATADKHPCPRCSRSIAKGTAFCPHCGAALAMWQIHRAAVQAAGAGAQGKPRPVINASLCVGCGSCVHVCPEQGTLELVGGKAILNHPGRCTGHSKCAEVCPTQAITLSFGGVLQTVRVPHVHDNFETNIPGIFIVGELGGMGLIKTAVNEGKLVMDHLRERLSRPGQNGSAEVSGCPPEAAFDVIIVGSGPAGLSASLSAHQYGLRYLTLEQGEIASTIRQYPRQKFLMAEPVEIPLYGSLYVGDGTKETLLSVWETIIANTGVRVQTNERVERVRKNGTGFFIETPKGRYHGRSVVLALGRRGTPRKLGVPGENLSKVFYRLIEAETYQNEDLLLVGGGDSAVEAALALARSGSNRVTLSYRGEDFRRVRERNQQQLAAAEQQQRLQVLRNSEVAEIHADSVALVCKEERRELPNQFAFILIGGESPEDFLHKTGIAIVEKALSA